MHSFLGRPQRLTRIKKVIFLQYSKKIILKRVNGYYHRIYLRLYQSRHDDIEIRRSGKILAVAGATLFYGCQWPRGLNQRLVNIDTTYVNKCGQYTIFRPNL